MIKYNLNKNVAKCRKTQKNVNGIHTLTDRYCDFVSATRTPAKYSRRVLTAVYRLGKFNIISKM